MMHLISQALLLLLPLPGAALSRSPLVSSGGGLQFLSNESGDEGGRDCARLTNVEGTHYIIPVLVGTPPQAFSLIPDTGSPWVIVADTKCSPCHCGKHGENKCFDESRSTSLGVPRKNATAEGPEMHSLMFGSGPISIAVASDVVQIAGTPYQTSMKSGVLLMLDHELTFSGPFEGLLGLSLPEHKLDPAVLSDFEPHSYTDGFIEKCGIKSFSICLSDKGWTGSGGVLRFNAPGGDEKLGITANTMHWQVAFHGASVGGGERPAPMDFCRSTPAYQRSPCAAIVDSGTTYMLGPQSHILSLFDGLCDQWERCRARYQELTAQAEAARSLLGVPAGDNGTSNVTGAGGAGAAVPYLWTRASTFQVLLSECNEWMGHRRGLQEMAPVHFTVKGRRGNEQLLRLDPWDYIVAERGNKVEVVYAHLHGHAYATGLRKQRSKSWTCTAAFASMNFPTYENGPAWLFGLPIFYSHVVSYESDTTPPSMSFKRGKCGGCGKGHTVMRTTPPQKPRRIYGPPRLPRHASRMQLI